MVASAANEREVIIHFATSAPLEPLLNSQAGYSFLHWTAESALNLTRRSAWLMRAIPSEASDLFISRPSARPCTLGKVQSITPYLPMFDPWGQRRAPRDEGSKLLPAATLALLKVAEKGWGCCAVWESVEGVQRECGKKESPSIHDPLVA